MFLFVRRTYILLLARQTTDRIKQMFVASCEDSAAGICYVLYFRMKLTCINRNKCFFPTLSTTIKLQLQLTNRLHDCEPFSNTFVTFFKTKLVKFLLIFTVSRLFAECSVILFTALLLSVIVLILLTSFILLSWGHETFITFEALWLIRFTWRNCFTVRRRCEKKNNKNFDSDN